MGTQGISNFHHRPWGLANVSQREHKLPFPLSVLNTLEPAACLVFLPILRVVGRLQAHRTLSCHLPFDSTLRTWTMGSFLL